MQNKLLVLLLIGLMTAPSIMAVPASISFHEVDVLGETILLVNKLSIENGQQIQCSQYVSSATKVWAQDAEQLVVDLEDRCVTLPAVPAAT